MRADVACGEVVVEVVPEELTEGDGYDGREVDVADRAGAEAVPAEGGGGFEEDGGGDVDADCPHEGEGAEGGGIVSGVGGDGELGEMGRGGRCGG